MNLRTSCAPVSRLSIYSTTHGVRPHPTSRRSLMDSLLIPVMRWTLQGGKDPLVAWYVPGQVSRSTSGGGLGWGGCGRLRIPTWWRLPKLTPSTLVPVSKHAPQLLCHSFPLFLCSVGSFPPYWGFSSFHWIYCCFNGVGLRGKIEPPFFRTVVIFFLPPPPSPFDPIQFLSISHCCIHDLMPVVFPSKCPVSSIVGYWFGI